MDLYIDKTNLKSFLSSKDNPLFQDCLKLFKKQLNIKFNFDKSELIKDEMFLPLITILTEGVGESEPVKYNASFPEKPLKSNIHNKFTSEQLSAIYLLDDERVDAFKDAGAVIVGAPGDEMSIFKRLFLNYNDYIFEKDLRIGSEEFASWSDIECYSLPLTDLIIVDPYLLKDRTDDDLDENLLSWIESICIKSKSKINIVIATRPLELDYDLTTLGKKIKEKLKQVTGKKSDVTFVFTYQEHDRTIMTNYLRYSGNTFNYFQNGEKRTSGKDFNIKSLVRADNHQKAKEALNDVQKIVFSCMENGNIKGDKISGYLKFT